MKSEQLLMRDMKEYCQRQGIDKTKLDIRTDCKTCEEWKGSQSQEKIPERNVTKNFWELLSETRSHVIMTSVKTMKMETHRKAKSPSKKKY